MRAERGLLGKRIASVGPIFNLVRSEHFLAEEATANGACLYLGAMPNRPPVRGTEPMTLRQIKDRGYRIIRRHSGLLLQRGMGWQLVAVGTRITPRPPHRSRRALLRTGLI